MRRANMCMNKNNINPIADDVTVHIIDNNENELPLRSFVARTLLWFGFGKFAVAHLTYADNQSKSISSKLNNISYVIEKIDDSDEIRLSYKNEEEYLEYFLPQFVSWYANGSGITINYSKFVIISCALISLCFLITYKGEPIELCNDKINCVYIRHFSAHFMHWLASGSFATAHLQYVKNYTGIVWCIRIRFVFLFPLLKDPAMLKFNTIKVTDVVYFTQQFSSWFMTKNMEPEAEGAQSNCPSCIMFNLYRPNCRRCCGYIN